MKKLLFPILPLILFAFTAPVAAQTCSTPGDGEFEYLVGEWNVSDSPGKITVKKILAGCGYFESWELEDFEAVVVRTYDKGSGNWSITFSANDLAPQIWEGRLEAGTWQFYRDWSLDGESRRSRTSWRKLDPDRFERVVEQSTDSGKTWRPHVRSVYERAGASRGSAGRKITVRSAGWRLVGDFVVPLSPGKVPAVLMLNKANGTREVYTELANSLARRGIASLRIDLRAHGESDNLGKFGPPFDEKMRAMLVGSDDDVNAALEFLRSEPKIDPARLGVVGASYSGEQMALGARKKGFVKAYVAMSPGSFSDESIAEIDGSGIPWFFIRSVGEIALMNDVFAAVRQGSKEAQIMIVSGTGHGSDILADHPNVNEIIAVWFKEKL